MSGYAWARHVLGRPDGYLPKFRCWLLGHRWWTCDDKCCEGKTEWCHRCLTLRPKVQVVDK